MNLPPLTPNDWSLALLAALCVGLAKSGFGGFGMLPILLMASLFPARESTGALLPLLIFGDLFAVATFRRHAQWPHVWRLLPPAATGIAIGWLLMQRISDQWFRPLIGWIVLVMVLLQTLRRLRPGAFQKVPHAPWFARVMGAAAGLTTMMANAAGPVMNLYLVAVEMPKLQFVGTAAWFFLIVNLFKVPFSWQLGLITPEVLTLDMLLIPAIGLGILTGRFLLDRVSQQLFELLVLISAALASFRLIAG